VYGLEKLHSALLHRPQGKPLLTVRARLSCGTGVYVCLGLIIWWGFAFVLLFSGQQSCCFHGWSACYCFSSSS